MSDLTPGQESVLRLITEGTKADGRPPMLNELCVATGLDSSVVSRHLRDLQHMGRIVVDLDRPRAITIVDGAA